ncbi:MAG: hypothetical protein JSR91_10990, partial [Proteobacteria bacterium]|nr:hypothetical protein [Pseudomonadota bacterium]
LPMPPLGGGLAAFGSALPPTNLPSFALAIARMNASTPGFHLTPGLRSSAPNTDGTPALPPLSQLVPPLPIGLTPLAAPTTPSASTPSPLDDAIVLAQAGDGPYDPTDPKNAGHETRKRFNAETPLEEGEHHEPLKILPPPPMGLPGLGPRGGTNPAPQGARLGLAPPAASAKPPVPLGSQEANGWGKPETLTKHFKDHGADFGATSEEDYARKAQDFLRRAQLEQLPMKVDSRGDILVYDPTNNIFGAYNADGTTKTFYRPEPAIHGQPTNMDYWNSQRGSTKGNP